MANELVTDDVLDDEEIGDDLITDAMLRESVALSVIGRSANSTGNPADIAAVAASGAVLREAGSVLGFGTIAAAGIAADAVITAKILDAAVTRAKLSDSAAVSVIGRSANTSGVPADIAAASNLQYFGRRSNALGFFDLTEDDIGKVISRQTLGAAQTDLTFAVADTDERIEIEGYGDLLAAAITVQINGGATAVLYSTIRQTTGGAVGASSTIMFGTFAGPGSFRFWMDIKNLGLHRNGHFTGLSKTAGSAPRQFDTSFITWPEAVSNITSIVIHSDTTDTFKVGFRAIARRRKIT